MFEDKRITQLRNYRSQLVAFKGSLRTISTQLGKAWTVNDKPNGVAGYVKSLSVEIDDAINKLDNEIAKAKAILKKKD